MLICLIGTGGTGKSTLAKALAKSLNFDYREVPTREVPLELRCTDAGQSMALEYYEEFYKSLTKDTVCTRTLFDVLAYSKAYNCWDDDYIRYTALNYKYSSIYPDHIFHLPIKFDIEKDGDREKFADKREEVADAMLEIMHIVNANYYSVKSDGVSNRVNEIKEVLSWLP